MDISYMYVTCGLLFIIFLLLCHCIGVAKKKVEGFPYYHLVPYLIYCNITGKIPKDVPITNFFFNELMDICKRYTKEGLLMGYINRPILFIFGEDVVKFFSNEKAAVDKSPEYDIVGEVMGDGVGMRNGERWRAHRKIINPAFHMGVMKDRVPLFNEHALALVSDMEKLAGKPSVNLLEALKINYFNALSESVFGFKQIEENKVENLRCFSLIDSLSGMAVQRIAYPWYRPKLLLNFTPFGRKFQRETKEYKSFITKVINDMKDYIASNQNVNNQLPVTADTDRFSKHLQKSFTYLLLRQHFNDPSFTFQNLHDEVSTILITGYDTVTYTTLWCLFLLGLHPEVQERAFEEVQSVTGSYVTYEECSELVYLEAIIMETLRLYPTVPIFTRALSEDVQYDKYKVYKGTTIAYVSYLSHRNSEIYPNPEKFEPERFLNAEARTAWSYIPFSVGNRICLGKKYAIIEMKIFLAHILRNFKISSLDQREDIGLCWNISLLPASPIRFKITSRNSEDICCNSETDALVQMKTPFTSIENNVTVSRNV